MNWKRGFKRITVVFATVVGFISAGLTVSSILHVHNGAQNYLNWKQENYNINHKTTITKEQAVTELLNRCAITIPEFRKIYPEYNDLNDIVLAKAIHKRFRPDMPFDEFYYRIQSPVNDINSTKNLSGTTSGGLPWAVISRKTKIRFDNGRIATFEANVTPDFDANPTARDVEEVAKRLDISNSNEQNSSIKTTEELFSDNPLPKINTMKLKRVTMARPSDDEVELKALQNGFWVKLSNTGLIALCVTGGLCGWIIGFMVILSIYNLFQWLIMGFVD
jgi:hypothetical protein